jgi:hypothetical protein
MLDEVPKAGEAWASDFERFYKGRAIIFDTWITAVPGPESSSRYEIAYRVFPSGEGASFRGADTAQPDRFAVIDLSGFELFEMTRPSTGDRVTFGARLAFLGRDQERKRYVVRLEPKSGVYILHTKALEAIGWPPFSAVDEGPQEIQP